MRLGLPRCGDARKGSALRADGQGVRQTSAVLLLTVLATATAWGAEPSAVFHKRVSEVQFTLVATDQNNRPVPRLSPADIMVLDDGQPVPRFELRAAGDLPLRLGIVLDLSDSTQKSWSAVRGALVRSFGRTMSHDDELLLLAFNSKIELERVVRDPDQLTGALENPASGGLTALYDTLYTACDHKVFTGDSQPHRSALVLFSDGDDDLSLHGESEAIARAQRSGIAIYTVTAHNPKKKTSGDVVLHNLAQATGGRDFVAKDAAQLEEALAAINDELRSSYLLYYRVPDDSGKRAFRRVRVIPTLTDGAQVRSREGYFTAP